MCPRTLSYSCSVTRTLCCAAMSRVPATSRWTGSGLRFCPGFSPAASGQQCCRSLPATILRWHRCLAARKWTYTDRRRAGRPSTAAAVKKLILQMARDNPGWGHRRIQGELARFGHQVAPSTVWEVLNAAGIDPAPRRSGPTWRRFLSAQAHGIIACDFFAVDTAVLKRIYVLAFIEHGTRLLHLAGSPPTRPGRG